MLQYFLKMEFSVIEKITDVTPLELLGSKIDIQNRSNDKSDKNRKK